MSTFTWAKAAVICDVCRNHVDLPTQCGSLAKACGSNESIGKHTDAGHFDCNICLDECHDPVVTQCGHLFCWPCLYYWLSLHSVSKECPVCKANVQDKIVPLYGRGKAEHSMNSATMMFPDMRIPCRPLPNRSDVPVAVTDHDGERTHAIQDYESHTISARRHAAPSASVGFLPSMLRCGVSIIAPQKRLSNDNSFVLHWAFIVVASIAIVFLIVC